MSSWRTKTDPHNFGDHFKVEKRGSDGRLPARAGQEPNDRVAGIKERDLSEKKAFNINGKMVFLTKEQLAREIEKHPDSVWKKKDLDILWSVPDLSTRYANLGSPTGKATTVDLNKRAANVPLVVKKVRILRAEGPAGECGTWKSFDSVEAANKQLTDNSWRMPQDQLGYDKHDFEVIFTNGQKYTGRYDLHRNEIGDIAGHIEDFKDYRHRIAADHNEQIPESEEKEWAAVIRAVKSSKAKTEKKAAAVKTKHKSIEALQAESREAYKQGKPQPKVADLRKIVYQTTIGHYGGLYVTVPEEHFKKFKSNWPAGEFPRKVESKDYNDQTKYHPNALSSFHKTFPGLSGKTKEVYFSHASKGERRLDFMDLPSDRETNPGD